MRLNGKIQKIKRKGYVAIRCSIVRSYRHFGSGRSMTEVKASFPTLKSTDVNDPKIQTEFWKRVESTLAKLMLTDGLGLNNAQAIRERFASVIPKPILRISLPKADSTPNAPNALHLKYPFLSKK